MPCWRQQNSITRSLTSECLCVGAWCYVCSFGGVSSSNCLAGTAQVSGWGCCLASPYHGV
jgi:hypothetical protein